MLLNAKPEELIKYSKGTYDKEVFIQSVRSNWELTDKQIRMTFLIADLAQKAEGAFSVSNEKFREMYESRFKMTISRSTVIRFFQLLEELGLLSINEARRKNRQQSANIFIINSVEALKDDLNDNIPINETLDETPLETAYETLEDTHNIALNNAFNKDLNKPLNIPVVNNVVNNTISDKNKIIDKLKDEFIELGLNEDVIFRVIQEVEESPNVKNFGGYLRTCLTNTLYKVELKTSKITGPSKIIEQPIGSRSVFYNWLIEREDSGIIESTDNSSSKDNKQSILYDWLNA